MINIALALTYRHGISSLIQKPIARYANRQDVFS
ncbi:hypothetical protein Hneap_0863 [Halothiobacillus neapolitanus c2]|uniref:Uncharacterized protein n=1 Tax=Halothiobacillus neapolitanus (strain ATCC 23641 / DSM 15147 / CIP 104769 / NCIMB 8539 / c2) TaxID=555778 RepID=D0KZ35_HALNC|nr:hypothetical protein Hneap_0863 [Halothiobacillus neapolitanus c2]TDN66014.1 hypothetical protein C8D83_101334 [Halothiobacillus neapolitanus]